MVVPTDLVVAPDPGKVDVLASGVASLPRAQATGPKLSASAPAAMNNLAPIVDAQAGAARRPRRRLAGGGGESNLSGPRTAG